MDGSLLDAGDLEALNFKVCILHQDLLAVNARMIETALHRNLFHGPVNKNRLFSHCGASSYFVILPARSQSGPINMIGRQQIATLNGPNLEIPRWTDSN